MRELPLGHPWVESSERPTFHPVTEEGIVRKAAILSVVALAVFPMSADAQEQPQPVPRHAFGVIDFGVRGTTVDGDPARYERYRDLGDGAFLQRLRVNRETTRWVLDFTGDNLGRRDQRFVGGVIRPGKFKGWARWDQIPMLLSRTTRTLFVEDLDSAPGVLTIPDTIQAQGQASPGSMVNLFDASSRVFDTETHRHTGTGGFEYLPTEALTIRSTVQFTDRQGTLPYGGSFGHSSLVEIPAPIRHTTTDLIGDAEFSRDPVLLRVGYSASFFHNDATTVTFDNPFRLADIASTPSRGRSSLAPSSTSISVNAMGSLKFPGRSRATAYVSLGSLEDAGDPLMPQTVNTVLAVAPLERSRVEGQARTTAVTLRFVSRPTRYTDFNVQFRSYDFDNRTPVFSLHQRVSYDNTPSDLGSPVHTETFDVVRRSFDAEFKLTPASWAVAGIGFARIGEDRTHRIFESTADNVFRVTFDAVGTGLFSIRSKYERGERRGEGIERGEIELAAIGEQPGMRHFDIAPRDRDRVTIVAAVTPSATLSVTGSLGAGRDDYRLELPGTNTPLESLFGLRDNTHRVYSAGIDLLPRDAVVLSGSYSFERYNALSRSRQANPGEQFVDPRRNWSAEGTDLVHSLIVTAGFTDIADNVDLQLSWDYNRARATYEYVAGAVPDRTLPEETIVETALPTPTSLPIVRSDLGRATADVIYSLTGRVGIGVSYWYEQYRVTDFTLDAEANPVLARGQALLMGYLYRPYTANTLWGRLIYRW